MSETFSVKMKTRANGNCGSYNHGYNHLHQLLFIKLNQFFVFLRCCLDKKNTVKQMFIKKLKRLIACRHESIPACIIYIHFLIKPYNLTWKYNMTVGHNLKSVWDMSNFPNSLSQLLFSWVLFKGWHENVVCSKRTIWNWAKRRRLTFEK